MDLVMRTLGVCLLCVMMLMTQAQNEFDAGESPDELPKVEAAKPVRYLMYEVNPGEGFNLRRDVYIRMANMMKLMNDGGDQQWVLVLPSWGNLYHWKNRDIQRSRIPWSRFFDLESLRRHVPVIELEDWRKIVGAPYQVDEVFYLQSYKEGWEDGKWTERWELRDCNENNGYVQDRSAAGLWHGWFWGYDDITAKSFQCVSCQAMIVTFPKFFDDHTSGRSVMIHRAEGLTHGTLSEWSPEWWKGRRSIRFSKNLISIGDKFRAEYLNSNDEDDKTVQDEDWTKQEREFGSALGGPYLSVHLRREDFARNSHKDTPTLKNAAKQMSEKLAELNLTKAYLASDCPPSEYEELKSHMPDYEVYRFQPTSKQLEELGDGGVAIIDQWIAAHGRHFVGTGSSTVSFRINEERSLLGFAPDTTYNRLCGEKESKKECSQQQPSRFFPKY